MNVTSMKERLAIFIKIKPQKKANQLQNVNFVTSFGNKDNSLKKKKRENHTLNYYFFTTIFSFGGPLVGWESATFEDPESLLLRSPLASNGRVARTISIEEGTFFSLG